jgi:hypothetical protein
MPDFGIMRGFNEKLFGDKLVAGQLPTQLGLIGSSDFGFDPDAQAFFDRVTTAGGSLTNTEKSAVNTLVIALKANSLWTPMKAIYPMVGASAAACAQNLKSSSFTGTFTSGWTFASTGATPNGTSAYFNTNFNPFVSSNGVNDTSLSVYLRTATQGASNQTDMGGWSAGGALPLMNINSTGSSARNVFCWDYLTNLSSVTTSDSRGMWGSSRSGASSWVAFERNTAINKTTTNSYTNLPNINIYLAAQNGGGSASEFSPRQIAFSHLGNSLTSTQYNNFYTAVQAFQTTLSRNV